MKLATLCYLKKNNETLMLYRCKKPGDTHIGKWNGLGGKVEAGETPEQCAIREVQEESGLTVTDLKLHGVITFPMFDGIDDWYVFVFTMTEFEGEMIESPEGELDWIPDDKLMELNLWEGDRIFLPWIQGGRFFSAKFNYITKKLIDWSVNFY
ncbi:MAG: 8-oxo-dGTP diphosphatase [Candidatus Stygibacter frigidus]|nr:8-oxo-dGTP diphosphatase [Candidatus Stygibacter frigidus]